MNAVVRKICCILLLLMVCGVGSKGQIKDGGSEELEIYPINNPTKLRYQVIEGQTRSGAKVVIEGGLELTEIQAAEETGLFFGQVFLKVGVNRLTVTATDSFRGNVVGKKNLLLVCNPNLTSELQINVMSGNNQAGLVGERLLKYFTAYVSDRGKAVKGAKVRFRAMVGGGSFVDGGAEVIKETDELGYAAVQYICGAEEGVQVIRADFDGNTTVPAVFMARAIKATEDTTKVEGVVMDQNLRALPGVIIRMQGQQVVTGEDGRFLLEQVESGPKQILEVIGQDEVKLPGRWPNLSYEMDIVPGIVNRLYRPIFLPKVNKGVELPLDERNVVTKDTTYELPAVGGEPPIKVTAKTGTKITFAPDVSDKTLSVTRIPINRVPMALENGRATGLYVSVQPSGTVFNPPLEVSFPNYDKLPAGEKVLLMSFMHEVGRYVEVGTGHVTEDGKEVKSDLGSGIRIGAWHGFPPEAPPPQTNMGGGPSCKNGPVGPLVADGECYDCDVLFCGVPGWNIGGGMYAGRVPSSYGTCSGEAVNCVLKGQPTLNGPEQVERGETATFSIAGASTGKISDWKFTDGTDTVVRKINTTSQSWSGVMVTSGTVSVKVLQGGRTYNLTKNITIVPRKEGWEDKVADANKVSWTGGDIAEGKESGFYDYEYGVKQPATYQLGGDGPNTGYIYVKDIVSFVNKSNWMMHPDVENLSSEFSKHQYGNYKPVVFRGLTYDTGYIDGDRLKAETERHEIGPRKSHRSQQIQAVADSPIFPFVEAEIKYNSIISSSSVDNFDLKLLGKLQFKKDVIEAAVKSEPPQPNFTENNELLGNVNFFPFKDKPEITTLTANGDAVGITVTAGSTVNLAWANKNTDIFTYYKSVSGGGIIEAALDKEGGVKIVYPTETTTYTFMAVSTSGTDEKSITVTIK